MNPNQPNTTTGGDFVGQSIGFKQVVMMHLNRLSEITSNMEQQGSARRYLLSVKAFESMMKPYATPEYKESREDITKWANEFESKNIKGKSPADATKKREELYQAMAEKIFDLLMALIAAKGLGIEDDLIGDIGSEKKKAK